MTPVCTECTEPLLPKEQALGKCAAHAAADAPQMSSAARAATATQSPPPLLGDAGESTETQPPPASPSSQPPSGRALPLPLSDRHVVAQRELVEQFEVDPGDAAQLMLVLEDERLSDWLKLAELFGARDLGKLHGRPAAIICWTEKHGYKPFAARPVGLGRQS